MSIDNKAPSVIKLPMLKVLCVLMHTCLNTLLNKVEELKDYTNKDTVIKLPMLKVRLLNTEFIRSLH